MWLFASSAFFNDVTQVRPVKTRDVFVRIAQLKLVDDIVAHSLSGAGGESCDWTLWKIGAQGVHLPVFRAEFVAPFRDAVRLINHKKRNRHTEKRLNRVAAPEPLR